MRLLEKEPANRFSGAAELEGMLRGTIAPPPASYATTRPSAAQPQQSNSGSGAPYNPAYNAPYAPPPPTLGMPPSASSYPARMDSQSSGDVAPSAVEAARWTHPAVIAFRKKLGTYVIVNAAILLLSLLTDSDWAGITALWTIYIAFKYAKLWSDGYDWRDVLKQPRDRLFVDVVAEQADSARALFDDTKRAQLRERHRRARVTQEWQQPQLPSFDMNGSLGGPLPGGRERMADAFGAQSDIVRGAMRDRDEIERLLGTMQKADRDRLPDVLPSANGLFAKVQALAATIAELDRNSSSGALEPLEHEITRLEAAANPLDRVASEERVKRLAYLKRQRRALRDMTRRRDEAGANLESCRLLLQNMRLDLVRLRTGAGGSYVQVTTLAERAVALAREVDAVVYAADEVRRI
jgi:eukaryotic-like serine/threonine-protein kinase